MDTHEVVASVEEWLRWASMSGMLALANKQGPRRRPRHLRNISVGPRPILECCADEDVLYQFIELPETAEDVQALWSPNDLRLLTKDTDALRPALGTQTGPKKNVETLLYRTIRFLSVAQLGEHFDGTPIPNRNNKILNAVRILTRILPYIYQAEHLREWEQEFFWLPRVPTKMQEVNGRDIVYVDGLDEGVEFKENKKHKEFAPALGETLIDCLMDYLFFPTLTQPARADGSLKPTRTVWQSGIGSNRGSGMTKEHEKAALEILRLLLVLASRSMYIPPSKRSDASWSRDLADNPHRHCGRDRYRSSDLHDDPYG